MAREADRLGDVDSAGVYFMSVEDFEARSTAKSSDESAKIESDSDEPDEEPHPENAEPSRS